MFSKACEYGLKAMISVAVKSIEGKRTNVKEIAKDIDSPEAFTAKILQQLSKGGIVTSVTGPSGGFEIAKAKMKDIRLKDIVELIDGDQLFIGCGLGLSRCDASKPCPIHHQFIAIRNDINRVLYQTTLEKVAHDTNVGLSFLNR